MMSSISLAIPVPSKGTSAALLGFLRGMGVAVGNGTPLMGSAALEQTTGADRYQIVRRISAGGMAEVHLARLDALEGFKRLVALKRLLPNQMEREPIREMFLREARLCGLFQHPNLVSVADVACDGEGHFFAMEYVRGRTLRELLMQAQILDKPLPLGVALRLTMDVCAGLHYAHELRGAEGPLGVVHRDVSPSNVLISFEGFAKVADFGVARIAAWEERPDDMIVGKWSYMAPEQLLGADVDRRADVFATAVLLYEMLAGRRLFDAGSEAELLMQVTNWIAPAPSVLLPDVPEAIAAVVARALAHDPAARFASARELSVALEKIAFESRIGVSQNAVQEFMEARFPGRELTNESLALADDDKTVQRLRSSMVIPKRSIASVLPVRMASASSFQRAPSETPLTVASQSLPALAGSAGRRRVGLAILGAIAAVAIGVGAAIQLQSQVPSQSAQQPMVKPSEPKSATQPAADMPEPAAAERETAEPEPAAAEPAAAEPVGVEPLQVVEPKPAASAKRRAATAKRRRARRRGKRRAERRNKRPAAAKSKPAWDPNSALPPS